MTNRERPKSAHRSRFKTHWKQIFFFGKSLTVPKKELWARKTTFFTPKKMKRVPFLCSNEKIFQKESQCRKKRNVEISYLWQKLKNAWFPCRGKSVNKVCMAVGENRKESILTMNFIGRYIFRHNPWNTHFNITCWRRRNFHNQQLI